MFDLRTGWAEDRCSGISKRYTLELCIRDSTPELRGSTVSTVFFVIFHAEKYCDQRISMIFRSFFRQKKISNWSLLATFFQENFPPPLSAQFCAVKGRKTRGSLVTLESTGDAEVLCPMKLHPRLSVGNSKCSTWVRVEPRIGAQGPASDRP